MDDRPSQEQPRRDSQGSLGLLPLGFWRRHSLKIAVGLLLVLCAATIWSLLDASLPVDDVDPERAKLGVEHPIEEDAWRRTDLRAGVDDPRTGTWIPTPSDPRETTQYHLYGGHTTLLSAEFVSSMTPGEAYDFKVTAIGEGEVPPDAFVAFATHPTTAYRDAEDPSIVARTPVRFHTAFFDPNDQLHVPIRYSAAASDAGRPLFLWLVSRGGDSSAAAGWNPYRGTVYPAVDHALRVARIKRGAKHALIGCLSAAGFILLVSPIAMQLWALVLLMVHRKRETLVRGVIPVMGFLIAVTVAPLYELAAFSIFSSEDWQGQRGPGTWRYFWTAGRGAVWGVWGAFASLFLAFAAIRGERFAQRGIAVLVLAARSLVSLGFVVGAIAAGRNTYVAVVPLLAASIDIAWAARLSRRLQPRDADRVAKSSLLAASAWLFTWAATFVVQYDKARGAYSALPADPPDCFVVSAAAKGHRRIVGSRCGSDGRLENDQLVTLRRFECLLATSYPELHRPLRRIYNCVGPRLARRLDRRWKADLGYLTLKPLEWAVRSFSAKSSS